MTRTGLNSVLLFLFIVNAVWVPAQEKPLFAELEEAVKSQVKEKITSELHSAVNQITAVNNKNHSLERLLEISHELSRGPMAGMVWPHLLRLTGDRAFTALLDREQKYQLYSEAGAACYYDNRFNSADSLFRSALSFFPEKEQETSLNYAFSCNFLGLINRRLGLSDSALFYFKRALNTRITVLGKYHPQVGAIYNNIGLLYKTTGDYDNARENYLKAIEIKKAANDPSVHLNYLNIGELNGLQGNYSAAISYYRQAETILLSEVPSGKLADLYLNMGGILFNLQAFHEAEEYFTKALQIYRSIPGENTEKSGKVYQNMANVYSSIGNYEKEMESILKAITIGVSVYGPDDIEVAPLYNNLGLVYQMRCEFGVSLAYLFRARNIYLQSGSEQSEKLVNTLTNIAATYQLQGNYDSAVYFFTEAIENLDDIYNGKHPYLSYACNSLARIYIDKGEYPEAEDFIRKAISANKYRNSVTTGNPESFLDPGYFFESLLLSGKIRGRIVNGHPVDIKGAFEYFKSADSLLSVQRNFLYEKPDKIAFARNSGLLAESALDCLSAYGSGLNLNDYIREAFRYVEKSKNLVLLQSINEIRAKTFSGIPDSILQREDDLLGRINFTAHKVEMEKVQGEEAPSEEKLFSYKKEYRNLVEYLERNYRSYHDLKYSEIIPGIPELQSRLGDDTALLVYFTGDRSVFRFLLLRDKLQMTRIDHSDMDDLLTGMRKGITLRLDNVYRQKAEELHRLLIPVSLPGTVTKLVIVPDGALSLIPFEALLYQSPQHVEDYSTWPFLVKKYSISYSPSLALWSRLSQNPEKSVSASSFIGFAPVFTKNKPGNKLNGTAFSKSYPEDYAAVPALPASEKEVMKAHALFREQGHHSEIRLFSDASESDLVNTDLSRYDYIHIATHGFINERFPDLSGLQFYPSNNPPFDNSLYLGEIYNLKLNARLLVLSACETGLGKIAKGEGILGFSRAFLFAGARNLVISLWKVNDDSTPDLMEKFYSHHLRSELTLAESLRKAKLEMIGNPQFSHPYYWAPFILTGN